MGKLKESMLEAQEQALENENIAADQEAAQQEAYYYHCIAEFYGMLKVFGTKKVMADLAEFKKTVELPKEASRIITPFAS